MKIFTSFKSKLQLTAAMLLLSSMTFAQTEKYEDFEKGKNEGASYSNQTISGKETGITWSTISTRTDEKIGGKIAVMMKKDKESKISSNLIPDGIMSLTFKYSQAFGSKANFSVKIGDKTYGPYKSTKENAIETTTIENIDIKGEYQIVFFQNQGGGQVNIDDLSWLTNEGEIETPYITGESSAIFEEIEANTTFKKEIIIKGGNLTEDLTVAVDGTEFQAPATLSSAEIMSETGAKLPITFAPTSGGDKVATLTISGGGLEQAKTIRLTGKAYEIISVNSVSEIRALDPEIEAVYSIAELYVGFKYYTTSWLHDNTNSVRCFNNSGLFDDIKAGDLISNITFRVANHYGIIEIRPISYGSKISENNTQIAPMVVTLEQLKNNASKYAGELVKVENVTTKGEFEDKNKSNIDLIADGITIVCRDHFEVMHGIIPPKQANVTGYVNIYSKNAQIYPCRPEDITEYDTSIENTASSSTNIYGAEGVIVVKTETATDMRIFNAAGQMIKGMSITAGRSEFTMEQGLYLVQVGETIVKVVVQ